jgi:hypothetical protein
MGTDGHCYTHLKGKQQAGITQIFTKTKVYKFKTSQLMQKSSSANVLYTKNTP